MNDILFLQKILPFMKQYVTLQTADQSMDGFLVNYDMNRRMLVVMGMQGQQEIPAQMVRAVSLMGNTVVFDELEQPQAEPAPPAVPAPAETVPVRSAVPTKEENKNNAFVRALLADDLNAAAATEAQPGALAGMGYSQQECQQIHTALYAEDLPRGLAPAQVGDRLMKVQGGRDELPLIYWKKALPETLPQMVQYYFAAQNWNEIAALGKAYPNRMSAAEGLVHPWAAALAQTDRQALLALALESPAVLHDPALYPALNEAAVQYGVETDQQLICAVARVVAAYPDETQLTDYETSILNADGDALQQYRTEQGTAMLQAQGYTEEQAAYIAGQLQRLPTALATGNVGRRFGSLQGNIHFLSEKYLWRTLTESPKKVLPAMFSILGPKVTPATALLNGQPVCSRDPELQHLYRTVVLPQLDQYDEKKRLSLLYLDSLMRCGQNEQALACAEMCCENSNDPELLQRVVELAESTDPVRYRQLIQNCRRQASNARPNEFEQMLLQMDRRVMDYINQPERLEAMGYQKTKVQSICSRLAQTNKYPTGNDAYSQYQRLYFIQENTNYLAERYLRRAIGQCSAPAERARMQGNLFTLLCRDGRYEEAADYLPSEQEIEANLRLTNLFAVLRTLYATGQYEKYLQLYNRRAQVVADPLKALPVLDVLQAAGAMLACGHTPDLNAMLDAKWNDAVMLRNDIRAPLGGLLKIAADRQQYAVCVSLLHRFASRPFSWSQHGLQQLAAAMLEQGQQTLSDAVWQGLCTVPDSEASVCLLQLFNLAPSADPAQAAVTMVMAVQPEQFTAESSSWLSLLWPLLAETPVA
ncbi:MAG: hypothetical protein IJ347_07045, partial [Faecalibacterium sp.]|nr:hypothetical protein [Faecalibacterium sp.]